VSIPGICLPGSASDIEIALPNLRMPLAGFIVTRRVQLQPPITTANDILPAETASINNVAHAELPLLTSKSQSDSVFTTLDQDQDRSALDPDVASVDGADKKPIYSNLFSRASGQAFICVSKQGNRLEPRECRQRPDEEFDASDGYLIIGEEIWDSEDDCDLLPEAWMRQTSDGPVPNFNKEAFFPTKLYFNEFGECSDANSLKWWGWFMKAPLLFDPTGLPPDPTLHASSEAAV
jgi:hypothetical protein